MRAFRYKTNTTVMFLFNNELFFSYLLRLNDRNWTPCHPILCVNLLAVKHSGLQHAKARDLIARVITDRTGLRSSLCYIYTCL